MHVCLASFGCREKEQHHKTTPLTTRWCAHANSFARGGGATNSTCLRKGRMTATAPTTTTKDDSDVNEMKKKTKVPFPHLRDIHTYEPTTFLYNPGELHPQKIKKQDWIRVFRMALPEFTKRAKMDDKVEDADVKSEVFRERFEKYLNDLNENEDEKMNVIHMCRFRDECLRRLGFYDCFRTVKREENMKALEALPRVLERLEEENAGILELVKGVFAGNIFDLGAAASQALFTDGDNTNPPTENFPSS